MIDIDGDEIETNTYGNSISLNVDSEYDVYYQINGGAWILYEGEIAVDDEGSYEINIKAVDGNNNESEITTITLDIVDTTCPDGFEYIDGECVLIDDDIEEDNQLVETILIVTGALIGVGIIIVLLRKFVFKI